ncbi:ribosome biogenesis protein [Candidatus Woesearchaeota archaeon]|nr:ribosome biogenesis protein [Candidatus Woesearchaeota archaeon]
MRHILKCESCGRYTMKEECCGGKTIAIRPLKFSLDDPYGSYRRKAKAGELKKKGLA